MPTITTTQTITTKQTTITKQYNHHETIQPPHTKFMQAQGTALFQANGKNSSNQHVCGILLYPFCNLCDIYGCPGHFRRAHGAAKGHLCCLVLPCCSVVVCAIHCVLCVCVPLCSFCTPHCLLMPMRVCTLCRFAVCTLVLCACAVCMCCVCVCCVCVRVCVYACYVCMCMLRCAPECPSHLKATTAPAQLGVERVFCHRPAAPPQAVNGNVFRASD